jgi:hypothetical protein
VLSLSGFTASSQFEMLSGCIPSNLKELKIHGNQVSYGTLSLSSLPKSLTKMDCNLDELKVTPESDCRFPESLKTLILYTMSKDALHLLPPDIEHVQIARMDRRVAWMTIEDWRAISRLTKLKSLYLGYYGHFDVKSAEMIPRSLEALILAGTLGISSEEESVEILRALPHSLTQLYGVWPMGYLTPVMARNLPTSLREMGMNYRQGVVPLAVASLPNSLTRLDVYGAARDYEQIKSFPANLSDLMVDQLPERVLHLLPDNLQTLKIVKDEFWLFSELVEMLPRGLKTLEIPDADPKDEMEVILRALPPSLTHLVLGSSLFITMSSSSSQLLPRTIKSISLHFEMNVATEEGLDGLAEWILGLPSSLSLLEFLPQTLSPSAFQSFGKLANLKSLSLEMCKKQEEGWAKEFKFTHLPRQLTHLRLADATVSFKDSAHSGINNLSFKGAPPSLIELSIPKSEITHGYLSAFPNIQSFTFSDGITLAFRFPCH